MIGIGLRVFSDSRVFYCILKKLPTAIEIIDLAFVDVPVALERPERLNFVRNTLLDIFRLYSVTNAVIRISEMKFSRLSNHDFERIYIEGVLQEALASCSVTQFRAGRINELQKIGGIDNFKELANGNATFPPYPSTDEWKNKLSLENRESFLAAYISLNL